ncbi:MAG: HAMP domain-containing histidine kinase [Bacteroidales bacterium]|nr:HAMP domain-containing histidine kinase [Bacteroidales bacterium]
MKLNKIVNRWVALGVSLVGIISLLILQFVWLTNAYEVSEQNLKDKCKLHLNASIEKEMFMRANKSSLKIEVVDEADHEAPPPESIIRKGNVNNIDDFKSRIQDILLFMGKECDIITLDSIFSSNVSKDVGFIPSHIFYLIKDSADTQYEISLRPNKEKAVPSIAIDKNSKALKTLRNPITVRLNTYQTLIIDITDPRANFIKSAKSYLLLSIGLLMLVTLILIFLMRATLRENRFVRFIKEYTNALTHDLRSPLNSVHMASSILYDGTLSIKPEEKKEYLRICKEQSKNMLDSIDRILTVAKAEHTELVVTPKAMPLLPFLQAQKTAFINDMIHEKPVTINVSCEPENLEICWDKPLMENVVNNLLDNAVKYSYDSVEINIEALIQGKDIHIRFSDNGMGVPTQDLDAIFKFFHQGSLLERKRKFGFGIGLSFLKKVVEAHDGKVLVESQEDAGATFTLIFPIVAH